MSKQERTDQGKRKVGRRSTYTQEIADAICLRLMEGESLRQICASDGMPYMSAVFRWLQANQKFQEQYAHAREAQAEAMADDIRDIADGVHGSDDVQRDRLRVEARKWLASKLLPKKYGDKLVVDQTVTTKDLTNEQLYERAADLERRIHALTGGPGDGAGGAVAPVAPGRTH